jgi:hypothetical protein
MRFIRQLAKFLLAFCVLFDLSIVYESWRQGSLAIGSISEIEKCPGCLDNPVSYQAVVLVIAIQIVLIAFLWQSKKKTIRP